LSRLGRRIATANAVTGASAAGQSSIGEARRRRALAQAVLAELAAAKMRGELVPVEEVARVWDRIVANCRARLLAIPSKLTPRLSGLTDRSVIYAALESEIHEALTELNSEENANALVAELEEELLGSSGERGERRGLGKRNGSPHRPVKVGGRPENFSLKRLAKLSISRIKRRWPCESRRGRSSGAGSCSTR
jgi:Phage DNA packaging protein Nu1